MNSRLRRALCTFLHSWHMNLAPILTDLILKFYSCGKHEKLAKNLLEFRKFSSCFDCEVEFYSLRACTFVPANSCEKSPVLGGAKREDIAQRSKCRGKRFFFAWLGMVAFITSHVRLYE